MQLVYYPDPILYKICNDAVNGINRETVLKERLPLATEMWKIMTNRIGCGLAAPQVGLNIRMFVWKQNYTNQVVWNPVLLYLSGQSEAIEACLSLPGVSVTIQRATSSILEGEGLNGLPIRTIGDSVTTRIWQHEIDHLDGKLIIDRMNPDESLTNKSALKQLRKKFDT
ncbi:hypothetical protein LCGC14_0142410 [marine sediment metagenome]|uniref:Peptide deformylase n=1 Tax=marine sediment metagenome TaxID=412755 RepID=A0A0F9XIG3_9ZZZZ